MNKQEIHITARAVIIVDNQILLNYNLREENRRYFLPGGHIEHYEKIEDTLKREMLEELHVECTIERLLGLLELSFDPKPLICHSHSVSFYFKVSAPTLTPANAAQLPQKGDDRFVWQPLSELHSLKLFPPNLSELIQEWLRNDSSLKITSAMNHSQK